DKEIQKIVNESMARARKILLDNKDKVELIAKTLLDKETLTNEEVVSLVETGELPKKEKKVEPEVQPQVQQEIKEPTKEENVPSKEDSSESKE
ncbi:MAG: cell division protein FtsH, partial [Erysipelotrichales bacterium]|nr:cell division protein FtsH [Erysipelotrichales bacterium]